MGYGGFFKSIVKIVAVTAAAVISGGNPLAIALTSAAATGATGGSFKDALISGATSYVGASIAPHISGAVSEAGSLASGAAAAADPLSDAALFAAEAGELGLPAISQGVPSNLAADLLSRVPGIEGVNQSLGEAIGAAEPISGGVTQFGMAPEGGWTTIDGVASNLSSFDVFNSIKSKPLSDYIGVGVGAMSALTLEQALLNGTAEANAALKQAGFSDTAIAALTQEARNSLAQKKFDDLILTTSNPFKDDAEFRKVVAAGIERRNTGLGKTVTQPQWDAAFGGTDLGSQLLGEEESLRRDVFEQSTKTGFPAFEPINNTQLIDQLLSEQEQPASEIISRSEARGNLNPFGGKTANTVIGGQREAGAKRLGELSESLKTSGQQAIGDIQSKALSGARSYKLGDELFDPAPFRQQAEQAVTERQGSFEKDLRDLLGGEQLFDPLGAITTAGKAQGQVSGASPALLDAIANRVGTRNRERGLGNRGSGVF